MLECARLKQRSTLASLVFVRVCELNTVPNDPDYQERKLRGYIFVKELSFKNEAVWKLPGGHSKLLETPLKTARRELREETHLQVPEKYFREIAAWEEDRGYGTHSKHLFLIEIKRQKLAELRHTRQEEARFFTADDFYALVREGKFMPEHYKKLIEHGLILPLGRDS